MKRFMIIFTEFNEVEGQPRRDYIEATNRIEAKMDYQAQNNVKVVSVVEIEAGVN